MFQHHNQITKRSIRAGAELSTWATPINPPPWPAAAPPAAPITPPATPAAEPTWTATNVTTTAATAAAAPIAPPIIAGAEVVFSIQVEVKIFQ